MGKWKKGKKSWREKKMGEKMGEKMGGRRAGTTPFPVAGKGGRPGSPTVTLKG